MAHPAGGLRQTDRVQFRHRPNRRRPEVVTRRRSTAPRSFVALAAVAFLLATAPDAAAARTSLPAAGSADATANPVDATVAGCDAVPGRLLVRFSPAAGPSTRAAARATVAGRSMHAYHLVPGLELVSTSLPVPTAVGLLRGRSDILGVQPDCRVHATAVPDDPYFAGNQWGLHNTGGTSQEPAGGVAGKDIDAEAGWDLLTDASAAPVAIIDTGMQLSHPDLAANLWTNPGEIPNNGKDDDHDGIVDDVHGANFVSLTATGDPTGSPQDDNGHGTHVAGIIAARGNNGIGVTGVAWMAKLMPLKVLDSNGSGADSSIIAALDYAAAHGARVTNNSYGGTGFDQDLYDAFVAAGQAGMLQVVAAGNDGTDNAVRLQSPGSFRLDTVISVAATDHTDALATFSDYGRTSVDVGAPGVDVASTWLDTVSPFSEYAYDSGTSMATPMVTGVAALVAAQNPAWTAARLRDWILGTTRPDTSLAGKTVTGGVVDLGRALGTPAVSAKIALDATTDTGLSQSDRITNANALLFDVTFPRSVTGLAADDFGSAGTATGCVVGAPTGSGGAWQVALAGCTPGTVMLTLKAGSVVDAKSTPGPSTATSSAAVTVDRTPPTVAGLGIRPLSGTNLSGTSVRLHATWTGADGGGAGLARFQLQASTTGGTTWTTIATALPSAAANVLAASSGTVRYRVRAVDKAGNVGGWLTGPGLAPRLTQSSSLALIYSAGWTTSWSTAYSGGSVRYATGAGRSVSYTFTGRSVAFVSTRAVSRGQVRVYIDGVYQATLSLAGATMYRYVAWQRSWAAPGRHTIRLVVVGTAGRPRIDLDAFVVLG